MNEKEERAYVEGTRVVYRQMLAEVLRHLGRDSPEWQEKHFLIEREEAISALRRICGEVGDNDWDDDLNMTDIIEKHLGKHIIK